MTDTAPGWDAIDARLEMLYPGVEPKHFGTLHKFSLGGPDPLDGVSFYAVDGPVPHWHIVGYGMSELYVKESDNADESGWGFELTFRVARGGADTEPPVWAANLLQNLARYVFSSGNWFSPGDHMNANGPISLDSPTAVTALAFTEDPELGTIGTPHGRLQFLQVVGLTGDEYEAAKRWDTAGLLALLADGNPLLVTDLDHTSITDDPAKAAAIEAGRARDGSSTGQLNVVGLTAARHGDTVRLTVPATSTETFVQAVRDRLPHGRHLRLDGDDAILVLIPADTFAIREPAEGVLELDLPPQALAAIPATPAAGPLTVELRA